MPREHELKLNVTDAAVWTAIRYLDPDQNEMTDEENGDVLVIYAGVTILALGCVGFLWLCRCIG